METLNSNLYYRITNVKRVSSKEWEINKIVLCRFRSSWISQSITLQFSSIRFFFPFGQWWIFSLCSNNRSSSKENGSDWMPKGTYLILILSSILFYSQIQSNIMTMLDEEEKKTNWATTPSRFYLLLKTTSICCRQYLMKPNTISY